MSDEAVDLTEADGGGAGGDGLQQQLLHVEEELSEIEETIEQLRIRQQLLRQQQEELQRRITAEQRAPKADWAARGFPWEAQLQQALAVFGLSEFRPLQREVINATLHGRDVLLLLASGGGKSLCFQLPAAVSGGVTLVVSPLLSLIVDQVMGLSGRIKAVAFNSLTSKEEAAEIMAALTAAAAPAKAAAKKPGAAAAAASAAGAAGGAGIPSLLLYVTPEKVVASKRLMSKLEKIYQAGNLSRIAIDEAHCCSTFGNDFRPDYKKLGVLKQQFPATPIIALTATATARVCRDITSILRIEGAEQFSASIDRPNLAYEVRRKPASAEAAAEDISAWIKATYPGGDCGIVYCLTRKDCEALAGQLQAAGIEAAHYHADMDPGSRAAAHEAWASGAIQVIVATISFGMGINKSDVRWVVHATLSKSLENYYQESGRAGRDRLPARCVLWYRLTDVLRQAAVVCMDPCWQRHLMAMAGYAAAAAPGGSSGCRRAALAAHFGEPPPPCRGPGVCDLCRAAAAAAAAPQQEVDVTSIALAAMAAIKGRGETKRATLTQLLDDMHKAGRRGSAAGSSSRASSSSSSKISSSSRDTHEWVVELLLLRGLLSIDFGFTAYQTNAYLVVSPAGEAFAAAAAAGSGGRRLMAQPPPWLLSQQQEQQQQPRKPAKPRARHGAAGGLPEATVVLSDDDSGDCGEGAGAAAAAGAVGGGDEEDDDFELTVQPPKRQRQRQQ